MSWGQWLLVGWLALSGLTAFVKRVIGQTRTYNEVDAILGLVEVGLLIWLVTTL